MKKQPLRAEAFILTDNNQKIPWFTVCENRVNWQLSKEQAKPYRKRMIENIGNTMSGYYNNIDIIDNL